ncbi:hypothetical protein NDU88_004774 [Pleurodeles waltl]|uniref:Uncharacterized protein n=1 Tax=Pleurodeles waltl TaxID=8319 RepID=A0AAV7PDG6_PLEWA|nr:hypothetical protein NDU88_004774 [Pleurodeles waltl]
MTRSAVLDCPGPPCIKEEVVSASVGCPAVAMEYCVFLQSSRADCGVTAGNNAELPSESDAAALSMDEGGPCREESLPGLAGVVLWPIRNFVLGSAGIGACEVLVTAVFPSWAVWSLLCARKVLLVEGQLSSGRGLDHQVGVGPQYSHSPAPSVRGVPPLPRFCFPYTDGPLACLVPGPPPRSSPPICALGGPRGQDSRRGGECAAEERTPQFLQARRVNPSSRHQPGLALLPSLTAVRLPPVGVPSTRLPRRGPRSGPGPVFHSRAQPSAPIALWGWSAGSQAFRINYHHIATQFCGKIHILGGPGMGAPGLDGRHLRR